MLAYGARPSVSSSSRMPNDHTSAARSYLRSTMPSQTCRLHRIGETAYANHDQASKPACCKVSIGGAELHAACVQHSPMPVYVNPSRGPVGCFWLSWQGCC